MREMETGYVRKTGLKSVPRIPDPKPAQQEAPKDEVPKDVGALLFPTSDGVTVGEV